MSVSANTNHSVWASNFPLEQNFYFFSETHEWCCLGFIGLLWFACVL